MPQPPRHIATAQELIEAVEKLIEEAATLRRAVTKLSAQLEVAPPAEAAADAQAADRERGAHLDTLKRAAAEVVAGAAHLAAIEAHLAAIEAALKARGA